MGDRPPPGGQHRRVGGDLVQRMRNVPDLTPASVRWRSAALVCALLGLAFVLAPAMARWFSSVPAWNFHILQPIVWIAVGGGALVTWARMPWAPSHVWRTTLVALLGGLFHASVLVVSGLFGGLAASGSRLGTLLPTLVYLGSMLVAVELVRATVFHAWAQRSVVLASTVAVLVPWLAVVPAATLAALPTTSNPLRLVGSIMIPELALSAVATWFVARWGPWPAVAYRGVVVGFWGFSPYVVDHPWAVMLAIGVIAPAVAFYLMDDALAEDDLEGEEAEEADQPEGEGWLGTILTGVGLLLLVGLWSGLFGVRLVAVTGISMEPNYHRGDLVVVATEVAEEDLAVGDVVVRNDGPFQVIHRVVNIEQMSTGLLLTTQGDNVDRPDPVALVDDIDGRALFRIPGAGWLSIGLRELLD